MAGPQPFEERAASLEPAIRLFPVDWNKDVDARIKSGRDECYCRKKKMS
jgi:hypothetical protein